jgi:N-acetylneuraminic acid mutarotase
VLVGTPISFTVEVVDTVNNIICSSYTGTIAFYSDDELASLPVSYTFSLSDKGKKNFSNALTFRTPGVHYIKIYDKNEPAIYGLSVGIKVVELGLSSWLGSRPLPAELANFGLLLYNDDIYIFGGRGKNEIQNGIYKSNFDNKGELVSWSLIGYLPKALHGHAVVNYKNVVYVLGGWTAENTLSQEIYMAQISTYSINAGDWRKLGTALPRQLGDFVAISTGNAIYLLGGRDGVNNALSGVWAATISTENYTISGWYKISELPERLYGAAGVLFSGYIYIFGGRMVNRQTSNKVYRAKVLPDRTLSAWESVGEIPQGLYKHSAVAYRRQFYILGGWSSYTNTAVNSVYYTTVDTAGALGVFRYTAPLPEPRYGHGSVVVKERIYTIGGWGPIMQNVDVDTGTIYPVNNVYSIPASAVSSFVLDKDFALRISGIPNIISAGQRISFKVEVVDRNSVPVHGYLGTVKFTSSDKSAILPEAYTFTVDDAGSRMFTASFFTLGLQTLRVEDPGDATFCDEVSFTVVSQTRTTITSFEPNAAALPSSVAEHAAVVAANGIYVIGGVRGGRDGNVYMIFFSTGVPYPENYVMVWSTVAVLPAENVGFIESVVVVVSTVGVNRIYIIGGRDMDNIYRDVWYAEINDDGTLSSWVHAGVFPTALYRHAGAVYNNFIYVIGGIDEKGKVYSDVKYMDVSISTVEWENTYPLPVCLYDHSVVVTNDGWIYVLGGRDSEVVYDSVYYAKIDRDGKLYAPWRTTTPLPEKLYNHVSIIYNDRIYVIGGKNSDGIPQQKIYFATINPDHTLSQWSEVYSLPKPLEGHTAVVFKDNIYIMGGYTDSGISSITYITAGLKEVDTVVPMPPENLKAIQLKGRRVQLEWLPSPSVDVSEYKIYCSTSISELFLTPPIGSVPHGTTFYITMPLLGYVTHYFMVHAVDKSGNEELNNNVVAAIPVDTLSPVKAIIKIPYNGKRINGNSVTVMAELTSGKISDVKEIFFEYKTTDSVTWMLIPPSDSHHTNPDNTCPYFIHWDVSILPEGYYNLRAVAVDKDGYSDTEPSYITIIIDRAYYDSEEITNDKGEHVYKEKIKKEKAATVSVASSRDDSTAIEVSISSGALILPEDEVIVTLSPADAPKKSKDVTTTVQDYKIVFKESKNRINGNVKITISYPENINVEEKYLHVLVYNDYRSRWEELEFIYKDLDKNNITFYSPAVGYFSLVSLVSESVNEYIIYPNPYIPHLYGDTGITFSRLPQNTKIEVYSLSGELVWEADGVDGRKVWLPGDDISSGMYIVIISDGKGGKSVSKIVIVR